MAKKHPLAVGGSLLGTAVMLAIMLTNNFGSAADQTPVAPPEGKTKKTVQPGVESREIAKNEKPAAPPTPAELKTLVDDNNAFAMDFYAKLKDTGKGNLFFSPYSISTALAMTYAGARGTTADEMKQALHFSLGQERLHAVCGAFVRQMNAVEKKGVKRSYQLTVANRLFGLKGYQFLAPFLQQTKEYGAELEPLDFVKDTEGSRQFINKWVEAQTNEKIKDLIPEGGVTKYTRLVLTNAIYFKGDWAEQFDKKGTLPSAFHLTATETAQVPMMGRIGRYKYFAEPQKFQALELPYKGNELSMLVFVPMEVNGLAELEAMFTTANLGKWIAAFKEQKVNVDLPKFKLTWGSSLNSLLSKLGMSTAFTNAANFSGMTTPEPLSISDVYHKAFVEVQEAGTEAAAATVVIAATGSAAPSKEQIVTFRADRPFLFLIRENATGSILFMGRMADPR